MSRRASIAARGALVAFASLGEAVVAIAVLSAAPADFGAVFLSLGGIGMLVLHVIAAALLAAALGGFLPGGRPSDRASIVVLYFIVAFVLPGAGAAGVALIAATLARGGIGAEGESEFVVGNRLLEDLAHGRDAPAAVHLEPLARSLRTLDTTALRRMVLALRGRAAKPAAAALLRRSEADADSEVQLFARSALAGATEEAETRLAALCARVARDGGDYRARAGIAELLLDWAANATGGADRERLVAEALGQLASARETQPSSARLRQLAARANLLAGDLDAAAEALEGAPGDGAEALELLYRKREWGRLVQAARDARSADATLLPALAFWRGGGGKGAAV